jgi:hypothetical protein
MTIEEKRKQKKSKPIYVTPPCHAIDMRVINTIRDKPSTPALPAPDVQGRVYA